MPQVERQQSVLELLENFRGLDSLRELFWTELSYNRVNQSLSRRQWTDRQREALAEDPVLWASAGADGGFHVIYSQFDDEKLLLTKERLVVNKLVQEHPYALFLFSNKDQDLWHFVNVKYDRERAKPDDKRRHLLRRITVGPEERLRTASDRIAMLDVEKIASSTLFEPTPLNIQAEHDKAFDVEAVTKKFFAEFKDRFAGLQADLVAQTGDKVWAHDYALRFLSRLMFLYFVQRKGWLGENAEFVNSFWREYRKSDQPQDTFFDKWLKVLFFEAFNNKFQLRAEYSYFPDEVRTALSKAPYLNGGLFSKDEKLDGRQDFAITDAQFRDIFDFLEGYNFTIAEDTPLDQEVAVDPEMIGKVYESLVNIGTEEDLRGEAGIFYTPRLEIDLMCRLALVDHLSNHLGEEHKPALYEVVFALDEEEKEEADRRLLNQGLWQQMNELVENVKVVDPACGSGSFLVGMMLLLADLRQRAQGQLGTGEGIALDRYRLKEQIIAENLYGVDVMEWAVHVAELRLWLQLVVDAELPFEQRKLQPLLPNLSFKVRQGDSLIQEVAGIDLSHIHGRTQLTPDMKGRLTKLLREKRRYFRNESTLNEGQLKHEERRFFQDLLAAQEKRLRDKLHTLKTRLIDVEVSQKELPAAQELEEEIEQAHDLAAKVTQSQEVPFIWDMAFAEVFEGERRGFDIVVGNPPYVRQEKIADPQQESPTLKQRTAYKDKLVASVDALYPHFAARHGALGKRNDYYVYFYLHGLHLLNPQGSFCFVTSNSWLDVGYGKDLQEFLLRHGHVKMILDNQVKRTFAASDVNTIIVLLAAPDDTSDRGLDKTARFVMFTRPFEDVFHPVIFQEIEESSKHMTKADYRLRVLDQQEMLEAGMQAPEKKAGPIIKVGKYTGDKWGGKYLRAPDIYWKILEKAGDKLVRLGDIAEVRFGIKTGCNEFFYLPSKHFDLQPEGDYYRLIPKHEGLPDDLRIEKEFLRPVIKSPREATTIYSPQDELDTRVFSCTLPRSELNGTGAIAYIRWGETQVSTGHQKQDSGIPWPELQTVSSRPYWYWLQLKEPGDFFCNRFFNDRFFFCYSDDIVEDQTFYAGRFVKRNLPMEFSMGVLNCTIVYLTASLLGRVALGEGVLQYAVYEMQDLVVVNPWSLGTQFIDRMCTIFDSLRLRPIQAVRQEVEQADRLKLDEVVFDSMRLTHGERQAVYEAVIQLVERRLGKAGSV